METVAPCLPTTVLDSRRVIGQHACVSVRDDRATDDLHGETDGATTGLIIIVSGASGAGKSTVSRLIAESFDRSVHLQIDDLMASVVSGWVDPNSPAAESQNWALGAALAVSAMSFAQHGYTTVVDGHLFPDGVEGSPLRALRKACPVTTSC